MPPKKTKQKPNDITMADIRSFFPKQKASRAWTTNAQSASAPSASDNQPPPKFLQDDCFSNVSQEQSFISEHHCNHRRSKITNGAKSEQGDSRKRKADEEEDEGKKPPAVQNEEKEEEEIEELGVRSAGMLLQERQNRAEQSGQVISLLNTPDKTKTPVFADEDGGVTADAPNAWSLQDLKPNLTPLIVGNALNANTRYMQRMTFVAVEVTPMLENYWYTNDQCALIRQEELNYVESKAKTAKYGVRGDEFVYGTWTMEETNLLLAGVAKYGSSWWILVAANFVKTKYGVNNVLTNTHKCVQ